MANLPASYKGIVLFTPGGDLVYCIDTDKKARWHSHLCNVFQQVLGLPETPHFLVPSYTATIDRWLESTSGEIKTVAECYPFVKRFEPLLNTIFKTENLSWKTHPWQEEFCNPIVLETYRPIFPQLWESHELIIPVESSHFLTTSRTNTSMAELTTSSICQSYILRLFVTGKSPATKRMLKLIHQLLEEELGSPYTLKVIDIAKHPDLAESHHISATPTLVRVWPQPMRRIVGELESTDHLLSIIV